jgi:hypothetical protein
MGKPRVSSLPSRFGARLRLSTGTFSCSYHRQRSVVRLVLVVTIDQPCGNRGNGARKTIGFDQQKV